MIREAMSGLAAQFQARLDGVLVSDDINAVISALDEGESAVWVTPPERITYPTGISAEVTFAPILLSPYRDDPLAGLDQIEDLLALVIADLPAASVIFDTLTLGRSGPFPAAQIQFDTLLER